MRHVTDDLRRQLLKRLVLGVALTPVAALPLRVALAADGALISEDDPAGKALHYVNDASKASGAKPGSKCANCSNYQGAAESAQGGCLLFAGKSVAAGGWCSAWAPKAK